MHEQWTNLASDYLDGDLPEADRIAFEQHLAACPECTAVVDDLSELAKNARNLTDTAPVADLWPPVAMRIHAARHAGRVTLSWFQLVAASLFMAVIGGFVALTVISRPTNVGTRATQGPPPAATYATSTYDRAAGDLLKTLGDDRGHLRPSTVQVLERSLATIDRAIGDARAALERDPGNAYLAAHLVRERRTKLAVLRQVRTFAETPE